LKKYTNYLNIRGGYPSMVALYGEHIEVGDTIGDIENEEMLDE
jgi:hypothetical protein